MIQLPTATQLAALRAHEQENSISIYVPYTPPSSSDNPNRIQFKNALKETRRLLRDNNMASREIDELLSPAEKLIDGDEFRSLDAHSLAVFIGQDFFARYHLPSEGIEPLVAVETKFHTLPLDELARSNRAYYVLLLNHNDVQLLKGDQYQIERLPVEGLPSNMVESLGIDEYPRTRQLHSVASASQGKGSEQYHGQYNESQVDKDMLTDFFRRIDHRLHEVIKDTETPLIISGVDFLLPLYRQVNTYPNLSSGEIRGNFEHEPLNDLRDRAVAAGI